MVLLNGERAVVSTLAGGISGTNGAYADASGTNAGFNYPVGVAIDASGNVFVGDAANQRIRKVTAGGGTRIGPVTLRAALAMHPLMLQHRREWVGRLCMAMPLPFLALCQSCLPCVSFLIRLFCCVSNVFNANMFEMLQCDSGGDFDISASMW
jgi:hypothetical protein